MAWYEKYKQFSTSLIAALMMVTNGYSVEVAAETNSVSIDEVKNAIEQTKQTKQTKQRV